MKTDVAQCEPIIGERVTQYLSVPVVCDVRISFKGVEYPTISPTTIFGRAT